MSIITTFDSQCRALASTVSPDEDASRFMVGTLSPNGNNLLYIFEYKDDNNNLAKISFRFPHGEIWHLSTSSKYPNLMAAVIGNKGRLSIGVFRLPDEVKNPIEDDYGQSESTVEKVFEPFSADSNLVRLSQWHPDDGHQLLTCDDGKIKIWDIEKQKETRLFSLEAATQKYLRLTQTDTLKHAPISDLRWSSLFGCSVIASAIGSKIYGVDTRIPDSSPASVCWLIEDQRCNRVRSIDFNPNSQFYIASGGDDCRANFWDLRLTSRPALHLQAHTHWIWSIRYNPYHDQLVLSAGSDARVALMRAQKVASDPYGQIPDDIDDEEERQVDKSNKEKDCDMIQCSSPTPKGGALIEQNQQGERENSEQPRDEVINVYEGHDDSVYAAEWASDPWIFASLGFESRLAVGKVPKAEKFSILF